MCLWGAVILPTTLVTFHKINVVGEANYKLQIRGQMQMSLESVKPGLYMH